MNITMARDLLRPHIQGLRLAATELAEIEQRAAAAGLKPNAWIMSRLDLAATKVIDDARKAARAAVHAAAAGAPVRPKRKGGRPRTAA